MQQESEEGGDEFSVMNVESSVQTKASMEDQRDRRLKRILLPLCLTFGVICVALFIMKSNPTNDQKSIQKDVIPIITTPQTLSERISSAMDVTIDPCEDFYQHACGNWVRATTIPADKTRVFRTFTSISDRNRDVIQSILDEEWPLLAEFYQSCMNESVLETRKADPLQPFLAQIDNITTVEQLIDTTARFSRIGITFLTSLGVAADQKDATSYVLYASQSGLSLPDPDYYLNQTTFKKHVSGFKRFITTLLTETGLKETEAKRNADLIVEFETKLAEITIPRVELRDPTKTYNPKSLDELKQLAPLLLYRYIQQLLDLKQKVIVQTPEFFKKAEALIQKTPVDTLRAVLRFKLVHMFSHSLHGKLHDAVFEFYGKELSGQQQKRERWKNCVDTTVNYLGELSSRYYVMNTFSKESGKIARDMTEYIEAAMAERLHQVSWMDAGSKAKAITKLKAVSNLIGHSDKKRLFPVLFRKERYFENKLAMLELDFDRQVEKIGTRVDRTEWMMHASDVNAYYSPTRNQIVFPAGILQDPFFNESFPLAMNYGAIGMVIGHELTHGFDDSGRKFDGQGNLNPWWSDQTKNAFENRTNCLAKQYDAFTLEGIGHVNGNLTLGENIADNGGLKLAYAAYQEHRSVSDIMDTVGDWNDDQLFFLAFAQSWCGKSTREAMEMSLTTDVHSPNLYRVNGVLKNSQDFAETFQCKSGTRMNPVEKCIVW